MMGRVLDIAALGGMALAAGSVLVLVIRRPRARNGPGWNGLMWLVWSATVTTVAGGLTAATSVLVEWPTRPTSGFATGCLLVPVAVLLGSWPQTRRHAPAVLVRTILGAGVLTMVLSVFVLIVVGLGRLPSGRERVTLLWSVLAGGAAYLAAVPARSRLEEWANQRVYGERHPPDEALRTFGSRMTRAVPLDELMLQLVETLRKTMSLETAELWSGSDGHLVRSVSVPDLPAARLRLSANELPVATRAQAQGNKWIEIWMPDLLEGRETRLVRAVAVAHLGELLGMLVVVRPGEGEPFTDVEDRVLVDLARQVGLAFHNVRLDSALQASLSELELRNAELVASRARIVAAADESRRRIERDLHDGAQQHLVALAVKVGLVKTLLVADPGRAEAMLDELREDVQTTLTELRELAHGIYPPLLRDRGLGPALENAANRATLHTDVQVTDIGRYDADIEAAVYFCCLEAMQNAAKYAGGDATVVVAVHSVDGCLSFSVRDDGPGFDTTTAAEGHGFVNMRDRLGAIGGTLEITAYLGAGTTIRGSIPATPLPAA